MTVGRCGDCRRWATQHDDNKRWQSGLSVDGFGVCQSIEHDQKSETREYGHEDDDEPDEIEAAEIASALAFRAANKAVTLDGSSYFAALRTREDFGCVLYEAKDGDR